MTHRSLLLGLVLSAPAISPPAPALRPLAAATASARPGYRFEVLGGPRAMRTWAYAINDLGWVGGNSRLNGSSTIATVWNAQAPQRLGLVHADISVVHAINNSGMVAGDASQGPFGFRAFRWQAGVHEILTVNGSDQAGVYDISETGEIVGFGYLTGPSRAVHWSASGEGRLIPLPPNDGSLANGINENGVIVGLMFVAGHERGFLYDHGTTSVLQPLPGHEHSDLYDVNEHGVAVGFSRQVQSFSGGESRAVVMTAQGVSEIPVGNAPGEYRALRINNRGQIIGMGANAPFLYQDGQFWRFEQLALPSGWQYYRVHDLNEWGQIVGRGIAWGAPKGFVLTPCLANIDRDPDLDQDDYELFYRAFPAGDERADLDHDGVVDATDEQLFLQSWADGC